MKNYDANIIALALLRLKDEDLSKLSDQELFDKYCKTCDRFMEIRKQDHEATFGSNTTAIGKPY